jgi:hypothetical protein
MLETIGAILLLSIVTLVAGAFVFMVYVSWKIVQSIGQGIDK